MFKGTNALISQPFTTIIRSLSFSTAFGFSQPNITQIYGALIPVQLCLFSDQRISLRYPAFNMSD